MTENRVAELATEALGILYPAEFNGPVKRYALIAGKGTRSAKPSRWDNELVVAKYLPDNYRVEAVLEEGIVLSGRDVAGWTLDGYVLPRLASGLIFGEEIDLSHPVMKRVPA